MEDGEGAAGRGRRESPYSHWQHGEGIPINRGAFVPDLHSLEVAPWPRFGQKGAFVNLADQEHDDAYVLEIAPGGSTEIQGHLFEIAIYVLSGRGATTIWQPGSESKQTVEWQRGTVFAPPLNCRYQHFNLSGQDTARLFAVTAAPMTMNLYRDPDFAFNCPYAFDKRYKTEDDYFTRAPVRRGDAHLRDHGGDWVTNYVADVRAMSLDSAGYRSDGGMLTRFHMSNNSMVLHIAEFPTGTYQRAHRHNVGAHLVVLDGQGYSTMWFKGREDERSKVDWKDGTVFSPRDLEYHQHFNTGATGTRCLAFRLGDLDIRGGQLAPGYDYMEELAGIPYDEEDPDVYTSFERECAKNGAAVTLPRPVYR